MTPELYEKHLLRERRARQDAERLLELKAAELFEANLELAKYADDLTEEIETQEQAVFAAQTKADTLERQTSHIKADLDRANNAVFQAERRLWGAVESNRDGFALFDADDILVAANEPYSGFLAQMSDKIAPGMHYSSLLDLLARSGLVEFDGISPENWLQDMLAWHHA